MNISVAICTWNRANLLAQTLDRMQHLQIPAGVQWELLVVNNCCTDDTDLVLQKFADVLPIRRLVENQAGHCHARNCAVKNATGALMLWTDDDVLVDPNWLQAVWETSLQHPEADFFGGPILPWFEGTPPHWIRENLEKYGCAFALRDLGDCQVIDNEERLPFGANFAIRTDVQRRFLYNTRLGRKGNGMLGSDETTVLKAIIDSGGTGYWIDSATVEHFIPRSRQTIKYMFRYFAGQGQVASMLKETSTGPTLFGRPRWLWRRCVETSFRYATSRLFSPPKIWCPHLENFARTYGALKIRCDGPSTVVSNGRQA